MKDFLLIFVNVLFTVIGHLMLKHGMSQVGRVSSISMLPSIATRAVFNPFVIFGLLVFLMTSGLWLVVLSRVKLSLAYPMLSISYILAMFFSWLLFKEHIPWIRIVGAFVICIGVSLVSITVLNVAGTIKGQNGLPVSAATVIIRNASRGLGSSTVTDAYGRYQFAFRDFLGSGTASGDTLEVSVQKDGVNFKAVNHRITPEELNKSSIVIEEIKLSDHTISP
jgi:drug/metabolite transporter (DMT)-like permease